MSEFKNFRVCPKCGGEIWDDDPYVEIKEYSIKVVFECIKNDRKKNPCGFKAVKILSLNDFEIEKE